MVEGCRLLIEYIKSPTDTLQMDMKVKLDMIYVSVHDTMKV